MNLTWRRRRCLNCSKEFTTRESIDCESIFVVIGNNSKKPVKYSRAKLLLSIARACDHLPTDAEGTAFWLYDTVEQKLLETAADNNGRLNKQLITEIAASVLKNYDPTAFVKYLSRHSTILSSRDLKRHLK